MTQRDRGALCQYDKGANQEASPDISIVKFHIVKH